MLIGEVLSVRIHVSFTVEIIFVVFCVFACNEPSSTTFNVIDNGIEHDGYLTLHSKI